MAIIKYAPFSGFEPFPALKAFEDTMNRLFVEPNGRPWVPPVDIRETENELVVKADIPDVKFEDIDVRMENGTLTVKGERKFEENEGRGRLASRRALLRQLRARVHAAGYGESGRGEGRLQERHADDHLAQEGDRQAEAGESPGQQQLNLCSGCGFA